MGQSPSLNLGDTFEMSEGQRPTTARVRPYSHNHSKRPTEMSAQPLHVHGPRSPTPYLIRAAAPGMASQSTLDSLPRDNISYDLAQFLRSTGPQPPPPPGTSKATSSRIPRGPLRLLKLVRRSTSRRSELNLRDEGGLLKTLHESQLPPSVQQKVSSSGKKYRALQISEQDYDGLAQRNDGASARSVTLRYPGTAERTNKLEKWLPGISKQDDAKEVKRTTDQLRRHGDWSLDRLTRKPVAAAVYVPSQAPGNVQAGAASRRKGQVYSPAPEEVGRHGDGVADNQRYELSAEPANMRRSLLRRSASLPITRPSSAAEMFDSLRDRSEPVRCASQLGSTAAELPVPTIEETIRSIAPVHESPLAPVQVTNKTSIRATVTTHCSGPISRHNQSYMRSNPRPISRLSTYSREEEKARHRRSRDRSRQVTITEAVIDVAVNETGHPRPERDLRSTIAPPAETFKASHSIASGSSEHSWKKVSETTRPVAALASPSAWSTSDDENGPNSVPSSSRASDNEGSAEKNIDVSVVEKPSKSREPSLWRTHVRNSGRGFAPRPPSASMTKTVARRRSRSRVHSLPPPPGDDIPAVPALPAVLPARVPPPPPPPAPHDVPHRAERHERLSSNGTDSSGYETTASVLEQHRHQKKKADRRRRSVRSSSSSGQTARINARIEALEKHNALLSAALMAVLKTQGVASGANGNANLAALGSGGSNHHGRSLQRYGSTREGLVNQASWPAVMRSRSGNTPAESSRVNGEGGAEGHRRG